MPLPQRAKANPRGQSQVGRSPVVRGLRKGKLADELRRFAKKRPIVVGPQRRVTLADIRRRAARIRSVRPR